MITEHDINRVYLDAIGTVDQNSEDIEGLKFVTETIAVRMLNDMRNVALKAVNENKFNLKKGEQ